MLPRRVVAIDEYSSIVDNILEQYTQYLGFYFLVDPTFQAWKIKKAGPMTRPAFMSVAPICRLL